MVTLTNREIVDGFIHGDPAAATAFHEKYSARISRWVWRMIGSDREHEDVVQQVFVNVFDSLKKIQKADSLDSWVDSVTIRTVRYDLRKRKAHRALFSYTKKEDPDVSRDQNSPFKQNHIKRFYEILNTMPTDDRIVFVLRFLEGYSIDRIAAIGNYSPSTAKRRLKRAKGLFVKKALKDFALVSLVEECHAV